MTEHEAAVISAYTGFMVGSFNNMHEYIEKILNRPVFSHELASKELVEKIREAAYPDLVKICDSIGE